jgi:hypothetical protein
MEMLVVKIVICNNYIPIFILKRIVTLLVSY